MANNRISRWGQVKVYLGKCFRLFGTEKQWKNFISTFIIVVLIAIVTGDDMFDAYNATRKGAFALVCACIWIGIFNSIQSICRERAIIKREHRSGVHISSYIFAHVIYEFFVCSVEAFIVLLVTVVRYIDQIPDVHVITIFPIDLFFAFLLIIFSSDALALLVSSGVKSEQMAMTIMPFVLIIQLLMAGLVFELEGFTEKLSTLTISRWGLNAICVISGAEDLKYNPMVEEIADGIESTAGNLFSLFGRLILFTIIYIVIAIVLLNRVDSDQR